MNDFTTRGHLAIPENIFLAWHTQPETGGFAVGILGVERGSEIMVQCPPSMRSPVQSINSASLQSPAINQ